MKATINMILFFLTISFCTSTAQAQARRAPLMKHSPIGRFVIRDSVSTKRVVDHRTTTTSRTSAQKQMNRRVVDHRSSVNKNTLDHRQRSNIVVPNNRTPNLKKLPPDGTSNTRNLRQRVIVKSRQ